MEDFNILSESISTNGAFAIVAYFVIRITSSIRDLIKAVTFYIEEKARKEVG